MYWDQLTIPEIAAVPRATPVLLPTAAIEQHGPHLPLATDRLIADFFAAELDKATPDGVLILPTLAIGCSTHHMDFPGSLSLRHETYLGHILDTVASVQRHGFRNFILFNCHGGNQSINGVALEQLGHNYPACRFVSVTWWKLDPKGLLELNASGPGGAGHACEFETSLLLHFAPQRVRQDKVPATSAIEPTFGWNESDMLRGAEATFYRSIRQMSKIGVVGNAASASAETGRQIAGRVGARLLKITQDMNL